MTDSIWPVQEYWLDAWQRSILVLDVLRDRGNRYFEHGAAKVPHVLDFEVQLVRDGRSLPRPVNYALVRMLPPDGVQTDSAKVPFIVVDPRAGHGPGIGGMKQESQIGMALAAGHPCYFIGFLPEPMPGQTVEDVCLAEATFVEEVGRLHADADGKPVVIANCQAGWQIMMMAAIRPELAGPILLAGSPLSYWAGVRGKNPLRYVGGALGGTWLTALAGDLGNGKFDGANLVTNFESLNPANTLWQKPYNLYSKVDSEAERFLAFEAWWGSPILLGAEEMQWIADNLFVGNKLTSGELRMPDGCRIDLRKIRSPIIVFCSWGDNITPPQQALGWITDLYEDDREIVENGQTIVYTMHQTIGHLGIFVSGKIANKEYGEFTSCMDMIDMMPPGLYEAVITEVDEDLARPELVHGRYLFTLESRSLGDIRALGGNDAEDDRRFASAARVSEMNQSLYRELLAPGVRAMVDEASAKAMRAMHPSRLRFSMFSDQNPMMWPVKAAAEAVRVRRATVAENNPLLAAERAMSSWITDWLHAYGAIRDSMTETMFLNTYGSPFLQALVGLGPQKPGGKRRIERDLAQEAAAARLQAELEQRFETGGAGAAAMRALIYIRMPEGSVDERGFAMLQNIRAAQPADQLLSAAQLKDMVREQFLLLRLDEERAVQAIPKLLPMAANERRAVLDALKRMIAARGQPDEEARRRQKRIEALFDLGGAPAVGDAVHAG